MKKSLICYLIIFLIAAAIAVYPLLFSIAGNEMGYCLLFYFIVFPLAAFVVGLIIGGAGAAYNAVYIILTWLLGSIMSTKMVSRSWLFVGLFSAFFAALGILVREIVRYARRK